VGRTLSGAYNTVQSVRPLLKLLPPSSGEIWSYQVPPNVSYNLPDCTALNRRKTE
jgi:hypothetical protein